MVRGEIIRQRLRAQRRNLSNTWSLFKESRIGVVGLAIIVVFLVIAIAAPYLSLRDPIFWRAPSEDVIALQTYWAVNTSTFQYDAGNPILSQVAFRVVPRFANPLADRVYAASGPKLVAIDPATGTRGWNKPFQADANITAGPVAVNFGDKINSVLADHAVFVGTSAGTLYALNDTTTGGESGSPGGADVKSLQLTGAVTSIAIYSDDQAGRNPVERILVGTDTGQMYAFRASNYTVLWNYTIVPGVPVRMASMPMNPPEKPSYSPAFTADGSRVFINAGRWYSLFAENGTSAWATEGVSMGDPWTSAPVVALPETLATGFRELVYAATDDGWLFARYADTGELYEPWTNSPLTQVHPSGVPGMPVMETATTRDPGPLFSPFIDSGTVYLASGSGVLYAIARDAVGSLSAGAVRWEFTDAILRERGFAFTAQATMSTTQRIVFAVALDPAGTSDPTDDMGILYALTETGSVIWRKDFDSELGATPSAWLSSATFSAGPSVWVGTMNGWVYSTSSAGQYLAPLAPGTYPSGNTYLWGTDLQGRDILSQFIWGSRIAMIVGLASAVMSVGIGLVVGLLAGYAGRNTDVVLMRFTDVVLVLPTIPLLVVLSAVMGASIWNIVLVISLLAWPGTARVIRAEILSLKERPYIQSARVTGASNVRIMFRHLTPNVLPLVFLYMTFSVSGAILSEAALSFLGLGDINTPSWGTMLSTIQQTDLVRPWWWLMPPGLGITVLSLGFFLVGRAFEQVVNPRLRTR